MKLSLATASVLTLALLAGGCGRDDADTDDRSTIARVADKVGSKVRHEMATQTLRLGGDTNGVPLAELTPQGDLLIDGRKVAMDESQRAAALAYRAELSAIAEAGAAVGMQGAELATQAIAEAASSLFDGDERSVEQRIEGKADAIRQSAQALCDRLPAFLAAQEAFATAVPEFAPYADADHTDIRDCDARVDPKSTRA